jgi:hypothetical protein
MKITLKEFEGMTREIARDYKDLLINIFETSGSHPNSAVVMKLDKGIVSGKSTDTTYFIVSPNENEIIYRGLPAELKKKMYDNQHNTYIIFIGWDGQITSYILLKDQASKQAA